MQELLKTIDEYFCKPLSQSTLCYPDARVTLVENGEIAYRSAVEDQPVGQEWELLQFDRIGDDLCYTHVGYHNDHSYVHEVLTFLGNQSTRKLVAIFRVKTATKYCNICAESTDEIGIFADIHKMLLTYCDSVYDLDADKALAVFDNRCHMLHPNADGQSFTDVNCDVFHERWAGVPHPSTLNLPKYSRIYHVELINENCAVAKVGMAKLNDHFNDYLFCAKIDGKWIIAQKLTESVWKNPPEL